MSVDIHQKPTAIGWTAGLHCHDILMTQYQTRLMHDITDIDDILTSNKQKDYSLLGNLQKADYQSTGGNYSSSLTLSHQLTCLKTKFGLDGMLQLRKKFDKVVVERVKLGVRSLDGHASIIRPLKIYDERVVILAFDLGKSCTPG